MHSEVCKKSLQRYIQAVRRISMLPFGGYVLMSGADPFGTQEMLDEDTDPTTMFFKEGSRTG